MPFVSPGVYVREFDYSQYVPMLASSIFGCLGTARKGPVNQPTMITNESDLIKRFHFPDPDLPDYGLYAAIQYLRHGRQLLYLRVTDGNEEASEVMVQNSSSEDVVRFYAESPGTWGSTVRVVLQNGITSGYYTVIVQAVVDQQGNYADVEVYQDVSLNSTNKRFIDDVLANGISGEVRRSSYIRAETIDGTKVPTLGTYPLTGGDDGISGLTPADYIGTYTGQTCTGMKAFYNPEYIDVNMLAVPGVTDPAVINELFALCEKRADCFAIIDSPFGLDIQGVIDWHNGTGPYTHQAFNTNRAGLYWPWVQVYDPYSRKLLWLPPSGFMAAQYAYTDYLTFPWFAPAGFIRGRLLQALRLEMSPDLGQRDYLYGNGNAVNPIVNFRRDGITVWGQRTLQRMPSALDRINVRRGLLYIEKIIATAVKYLCFEPNDRITWTRLIKLVTPALDWMRTNRGLYDFGVICDESTNTPFLIDNNELNAKIWLKPTKAAEKIILDFVILSTGASFSDVA